MRARGEGATTTKVSPADAATEAAAMEATAAVKATAATTASGICRD
jgi:hypothetical protein